MQVRPLSHVAPPPIGCLTSLLCAATRVRPDWSGLKKEGHRAAECRVLLPPPYPLPPLRGRRGSGKAYQNVFLIRKETAQLDWLDSLS